jgi:hypothetical protein
MEASQRPLSRSEQIQAERVPLTRSERLGEAQRIPGLEHV